MANSDPLVRRRTLFSGRVQGVGFRYTTEQLGRRFAVEGFVRNLPAGRVELVVEGLPNELDRFGTALADAMNGYIRDTQTVESQGTGEFGDFSIRH